MEEFYLDKIAAYLRDNSRLSFTGHKRSILHRRLETRMSELELAGIADYWSYLNNHDSEPGRLFDLVTTNETSFFRNRAQFSFLKERIIPDVELNQPMAKSRFRVLSAGCSTGEEPYSLAMTIFDACRNQDVREIEIVAGDLSHSCLKEAVTGFYSTERLKNLPEGYLDRFFESSGEGAVVRQKLKKLINFVHLNLNDLMKVDASEAIAIIGRFDVVFCRNVMIYFSPPCQQRLVDTLHTLLVKGGYLFTGDAEPLHLFRHAFVPVNQDDCLIYQKNGEP